MPDFISAGDIEAGLTLPRDALSHSETAAHLLSAARRLPPGAVIAIQGSWGRGKTDVLARAVTHARADPALSWVWINPWQYGTPDLLTPLVIALLRQIPAEQRSGRQALIKAAKSVLLAGMSFGMKASAITAAGPAAALLPMAAGPATSLLRSLFDAAELDEAVAQPDPDPVASMSARFAELVDAVLAAQGTARLLVCVDDLDRCLPDRQIALLQAVRFLISTRSKSSFLIALDPTLARQALRVRYAERHFDPDRYLDKMFNLRINLPALAVPSLDALIHSHYHRAVYRGDRPVPLGEVIDDTLGATWRGRLAEQAALALCVPELRNPRLVHRLMDRLYLLLTSADQPLVLREPIEARWLLTWLAMAERWPDIRAALQAERERFGPHLAKLHSRYVGHDNTPTGVAVFDQLPAPTPAQRQVFTTLGEQRISSVTQRFLAELDRALVEARL